MFDSVLGWGFGVVALLVGLGTASLVGKWLGMDSPPGRNVAIDGLRGYLAFGVFLHHAVIWYFYARTQTWGLPPPSPYREMGRICVSLFFMITAYLFVGKLLDGRARGVDWLALFVSRFLRLMPLYLLAMLGLFALVGLLSSWQLRVPGSALAMQMVHWLAFSITDMPDINAVRGTTLLLSAVTWSLAYEWLFYLSLPFLAVLFRVKVSPLLAAACTVAVVVLVVNKVETFFPTAFVTGAFAAFVSRQPRVASFLRKPMFAAVVLLAAWSAMFGVLPRAGVSASVAIAFCIVACGNTVLGILSSRAAVLLGDMSYGVYLLHGLLLSIVFMFALGPERAPALTPAAHWAVVTALGVLVVTVAAFTYRFIEAPAMRQVPAVSRWLEARLGSKRRAAATSAKAPLGL